MREKGREYKLRKHWGDIMGKWGGPGRALGRKRNRSEWKNWSASLGIKQI